MAGSPGDGQPAERRVTRGLAFRTLLASVLLAVLVVGGFGLMTFAVQQLRAASSRQVRALQTVSTANRLERSVLDLETGLRGYLLTGQPRFLQPYGRALRQYPALVRRLRLLVDGDRRQQEQLSLISAQVGGYVQTWAQPLIRTVTAGQLGRARGIAATGGGKKRVDAIRSRFAVFTDTETRISAARAGYAGRLADVAFALGIAGMAVGGLAVLTASTTVQRAVVRPLRRLAAATSRVAGGDLSIRVPERGAPELGETSRSFNAMAASLERGRDALEQQQARLTEALAEAEREKAHSELLRTYGDELAEASGVASVTAVALQGMADAVAAEMGALYLRTDGTGELLPAAWRGLGGREPLPGLVPGEGLAGRAVAEQRPVQAAPAQATLSVPGIAGRYRARHELHLPLRHGDRIVGVVSLGRASGGRFADAELAVLAGLADQAAVACAEALSRRQVERSAHEMQTLLASTDEGIYVIGPDARATLVNDAAVRQLGYARDDLVGRELHEIIHHSRADGTPYPYSECPVSRVFQTGNGSRVTDEVLWHRDGTPFPVEYSANPLYEGDRITGVVVSFLDIAPRKRTEAQRDTQHAVTRVIAEAGPGDEDIWHRAMTAACDGLGLPIGLGWLARQHGTRLTCTVTYAAPGFAELARRLAADGLPAGEGPAGLALQRREPVLLRDLSREPPRTGLPADPRLRSAVAIPAVGRNSRVLAIAEFFGDRDLAEPGLTSTLTSLAGQIAQYIERMRTEAETQRMKDEFVSTVSHELRTPLSSMTGWLHILLGEEPSPLTAEQRKFLTTIQRNSDRLMRQVGDLLLAGQIESGRLSLEFAEVDMAGIAREAAELAGPQAGAHGVALTVEAAQPAVLYGDRARLLQLADNLLTNAIKFTPRGGQVCLSVASAGRWCRVTVSDTGIGIPPEDRPHLFQRFYRASSATERGISGTGLGLAICQAIAEGHHGSIRLAEHEGPGSVFVVELPLAAREEATA
ncbi:MAG: ATP-binding protein [Gemmatimonadota bacterium]